MKAKTKEMLETIDGAHDWALGQAWSGGGTVYNSTDTCRICSMRRHFHSDSQNGVAEEYRFSDGETNEDLSLRQAVERGCVEDDSCIDCGSPRAPERDDADATTYPRCDDCQDAIDVGAVQD